MIPEEFLARMRALLGEEFEAFEAALAAPPVRALRVNTDKTDAARLLPLLPFATRPLPFGQDAYLCDCASDTPVGALPAHHAGMFYMQDPSAVCTAAALRIAPGSRVLDLCAAPGGKATTFASAVGSSGVVVANEIVPERCGILRGNVERMGVAGTVVTCLSPADAADFFGSVFDLVAVDAPCSGEGMFRKYAHAGAEWSPAAVTRCAARQRDILEAAARCVAPGGRLLYSTCTFSPEENEQTVAAFLGAHPDFSLVPVEPAVAAATSDGLALPAPCDLRLTRRFYPHRSPGEGQYIALMARDADAPAALSAQKGGGRGGKNRQNRTQTDTPVPLPSAAEAALARALDDLLEHPLPGRPVQVRDAVFLAPDLPLPPRGVVAPGICVGTLREGRLIPHHQLASAAGRHFRRRLSLTADDPRVIRYLRGETLDCPEAAGTGGGYAAVLYEGAPLGLGKYSDGVLKNHYPKGLRLLQSKR